MTRKRATKLLMACGLSRNQANKLMRTDRQKEITNQTHAAGTAMASFILYVNGMLPYFNIDPMLAIMGADILTPDQITMKLEQKEDGTTNLKMKFIGEDEQEWQNQENDTTSSPMEPTLITP